MIYPIVAYGDPILRKKAVAIEKGTEVEELARDMLATMDLAKGVGLAAPQIGKSIRLFVVDLNDFLKKKGSNQAYRKALINPVLKVDQTVALCIDEERCLSIPGTSIKVPRKEKLVINYFDITGQFHEEEWTGFPARLLQHEYDHLEGKLHIDYASPLRKRLIKKQLSQITKGNVEVAYKMRFPA